MFLLIIQRTCCNREDVSPTRTYCMEQKDHTYTQLQFINDHITLKMFLLRIYGETYPLTSGMSYNIMAFNTPRINDDQDVIHW